MDSARSVIPGALAGLLRDQPTTPAKVEFAWRQVAGPAMARAARVRLDDRGTLRVHADDPNWRREVRRSAGELRARLAALLGEAVVRKVTVART
jgi:predicted nucleic acid-binding Zn ribbon protein